MSSVSDGEGARLTERPSLLSIRLPSHCAVCTNTNTIYIDIENSAIYKYNFIRNTS